jgi:hydrogenase maturation protease
MNQDKPSRRILVAGMGNVLRGDDGFGVELLKRLLTETLPNGVELIEVGIAGLTLVQRLQEHYQVLILVDAVRRGGKPGTIYVLEPEIPKVSLDKLDIGLINYLADAHYVEPTKVLALASGLGILPKKVLIVGCEPAIQEEFQIGLSPAVREAVERGVGIATDLVTQESKK